MGTLEKAPAGSLPGPLSWTATPVFPGGPYYLATEVPDEAPATVPTEASRWVIPPEGYISATESGAWFVRETKHRATPIPPYRADPKRRIVRVWDATVAGAVVAFVPTGGAPEFYRREPNPAVSNDFQRYHHSGESWRPCATPDTNRRGAWYVAEDCHPKPAAPKRSRFADLINALEDAVGGPTAPWPDRAASGTTTSTLTTTMGGNDPMPDRVVLAGPTGRNRTGYVRAPAVPEAYRIATPYVALDRKQVGTAAVRDGAVIAAEPEGTKQVFYFRRNTLAQWECLSVDGVWRYAAELPSRARYSIATRVVGEIRNPPTSRYEADRSQALSATEAEELMRYGGAVIHVGGGPMYLESMPLRFSSRRQQFEVLRYSNWRALDWKTLPSGDPGGRYYFARAVPSADRSRPLGRPE
jgi:hypothetical protein